ncbi:hypothetical protein ASPZODRAFT_1715312 [Penicilliopsis zonata CBS 506.65]|uniref:Uncharacterized protein n=1 Tax=Penicilliopsis zonata CBS 506.65 TaxID=1073090 RepID=A0A1L9SK21_9EURO|nr:hypothetical protein ASPZODRAFT_1715312 [Penicilliopsis zonata CBS 506.65]OJJ47560.1 hypothetical protein ASPZODRAFT_1715312 [Penicilliopsis zonata CBS 506.65]
MHANLRAEASTAAFYDSVLNDSLPLWARLTWMFRWSLIRVWVSIIVSNFFDVAPAFATMKMLQHLERREADPNAPAVDPDAWKYVLAILTATVSTQIVDSRIMWWEMATLVIPMRSTLTGLMYRKLLRRRLQADESTGEDAKDQKAGEDDAKEKQASQDVINMFAVDCNQIAIFGAQNGQYVNMAGKFAVTVVFLLVLMGWQSLCAGLLGIAVLFPINRALASRYGRLQKTLMKIRDRRTALTTEALHGIRQIKFGATEAQWTAQLTAVREEELAVLWKTRLNSVYMAVASEFTPVVLTALSLTTYALVHGSLGPAVAFTAISLFIQLEGLVSFIPYLLVLLLNAKVSCDRIDKFLRSPDRPVATHPGPAVAFHNASLAFPTTKTGEEDRFVLRDVNLVFPSGAFSVISGPTGSGKSLLLAAILGEADVVEGAVHVPQGMGMAFVSQTPWLENATIRDNVLFGAPFDPVRYGKTVAACALTADLALLPNRDDTLVGTQGVALSGGQKWRVSLARALYSSAKILVLDDVFSALDAHVGRHVLENALRGELAQGRTRILATHHAAMCQAAYSVRLADGTMVFAGEGDAGAIDDPEEEEGDPKKMSAESGETFTASEKVEADVEGRKTGRVSSAVYKAYIRASGGWVLWSVLLVLFAVSQSFILGRTYWVRIWAGSSGSSSEPTPQVSQQARAGYSLQTMMLWPSSQETPAVHTLSSNNDNLWFYLSVYCIISVFSVAVTLARLLAVYIASIRASRTLFAELLDSVLHAPLRWLDTVPAGRILNRFTGDFTSLDSSLTQNFYMLATILWEILGILIAAVFVSPVMAGVAVVLLTTCTLIGRQYIGGARTIKRLESTSKSPVISHFSATLRGLATIRAFDETPAFAERMYALIDAYAACTWHDALLKGWLMLRVGLVAAMLASTVAVCIVVTPGVDASLAGFALSFALSFGWQVTLAVRIATAVELDMNSAERILEYRDLEVEPAEGDSVRASWPEDGRIEVSDLEVAYAEGLPAILKGLTFTVEGRQRIGVVGRTGAGKSTLSLALFRFLNAQRGAIVIDGVDISTIRLTDLRTRLAIIPQDPVLFSGTIRSNLDPLGRFSDAEVQDALQRVHLVPTGSATASATASSASSTAEETSSSTLAGASSSTNTVAATSNIFLTLSSPVASGGNNLSHGQKQLLCLARAILTRPKILVLDEATSAVDGATDKLIQRSIREAFSDTTLLVVAHRLSTVADFDRILVLQDGRAVEFGAPEELKAAGGVFASMVQQGGESL